MDIVENKSEDTVAIGLYLDLSPNCQRRQKIAQMARIDADKHLEVVIDIGAERIEMTLEEFIAAITPKEKTKK
ncbi:MAG: hypothetical protein WC052_05260 [Patescibacteria group bacterium]